MRTLTVSSVLTCTFLACVSTVALAQTSVRQSGNVTPGHVTKWISTGVIGDGGSAAAGTLSSLGVQNNSGPGVCVNSAPQTGPYNQICLSVTTNGGSKISSYAFGGATTPGITFDVNGTSQGFLTVSGAVAVNDTACFADTTGNIKSCGTLSTPFTVATGGTGRTTLTTNGILYGLGTSPVGMTAAMTDGQLLVGQTSAAPLPKTVSGDCTLAASGAITCTKINGVTWPSSGTSGGIPYFSSTSAISSSGVLAANAIVVGGGAGATPTTPGCVLTTTNSFVCTSTSDGEPSTTFTNSTNSATGPQVFWAKNRNGAAVQSGDILGRFFALGFQNSSNQNAATFAMNVDAAPSGSNVPSNITFQTSNASGQLNQAWKFNSAAHVSITQATAPAVSSCGTGSPVVTAGSTDMGGELTVGTGTPTACTLTFGTAFTVAPKCVLGSNPQLAAFSWVTGVGTIVVTQTATSSNKINWVCGPAGV